MLCFLPFCGKLGLLRPDKLASETVEGLTAASLSSGYIVIRHQFYRVGLLGLCVGSGAQTLVSRFTWQMCLFTH